MKYESTVANNLLAGQQSDSHFGHVIEQGLHRSELNIQFNLLL